MQPLTSPARRIHLLLLVPLLALAAGLLAGCDERSARASSNAAEADAAAEEAYDLLVNRVRRMLPDAGPLRVDWAADLQGRRLTRVWLPPADADPGILLVHTDRNELVAVERATGVAEWWTVLEAPVMDQPAFTPYAVYVVEDKMLTCLEIESGQVLWRLPLPFAASAGPRVREMEAGKPVILLPGLDRRVHALVTETETWPPEMGTHYVKRDDITIERIRLREIWHHRLSGAVAGRPLRLNDRVYAADSEKRIYAIDPTEVVLKVPQTVATFTTQGPVVAGPARVGDLVVLGSLDRSLYALDSRVQRVQWTYAAGHRIETPPAALHDANTDTLYVASRFGTDGPFGLLRAEDGAPVWQAPDGLEVVGLFEHRENPADTRTVAVLRNNDGSLASRIVSSGEELWRIDAGSFGPFARNERTGAVFTVAGGDILCALERDF